MEKPICCICGKECENEFGNNPYPIDTREEARCCDKCNDIAVIPARLEKVEPNQISKVNFHKARALLSGNSKEELIEILAELLA